MIKSAKGYLYGGTKSDENKPQRMVQKIQKQNSKSSRFISPRNFDYRSFCVDGARIESIESKIKKPNCALILLHGGGFLRASDDFCRSHMVYFASKLGIKVFMPDYSLMPNNDFPKQSEEILTVWDYVCKSFSPERICIVGIGSGANLALGLTNTLKSQNSEMPSSQVFISPWLDMSASGDSYYDKFYLDKVFGNYVVKGADLPTEIKKTKPYAYARRVSETNPSISPLFADLKGLPPTYINVGDYSILQSDAESLFLELQRVGVPCVYDCLDGQIGEYALFYATRKKAKNSMKKILSWIENALK